MANQLVNANNIAALAKTILWFLGALICVIFWGTYNITSYKWETKEGIDTVRTLVLSYGTRLKEYQQANTQSNYDLNKKVDDLTEKVNTFMINYRPSNIHLHPGFLTEHKSTPNSDPILRHSN